MPPKRKKQIKIDPWQMFQQFEDDKNFLLVIEDEDGFGNKKRMYMGADMKLVPFVQEKEKADVPILKKKNRLPKKSLALNLKGSDANKRNSDSLNDEMLFKSPIVTKNIQNKQNISDNITPLVKEKSISPKKSLSVKLKESYINKKNIDDDMNFKSPIIPKNIQNKENICDNITPEVKGKWPIKGILKTPRVYLENTPEMTDDDCSWKMMISSPIIGFTPRGNRRLKENRQLLLDKLKKCKETPILAPKSNNDQWSNDSLKFIKSKEIISVSSDDSTYSSKKETPIFALKANNNRSTNDFSKNPKSIDIINISSDTSELRSSKKIGNVSKKVDASSVLFPDTSSLILSQSQDSVSKEDQSQLSTSVKEESLRMITAEERKRWLQLAKRRSRIVKRQQGLSESFWHMYHVEDSLSIILKLSQEQEVQPFAKIFPVKSRKQIAKLGEGSYGEVFMLKNNDGEEVVVKFIPVEADTDYNGAPMNKFDDVLSEIVIAKELADLSLGKRNRCKTFVQMSSSHSVSVARGRFPSYFQTEWDKSNKRKLSENDNPKLLGSQQDWIVLQFQFAGCPLEDFEVGSWREGYSILSQVALALACAEAHCEFEHRDLHLGNVLVMRLPEEEDEREEEETFIVDGEAITIKLFGVRATIIDFTFSRINTDGNVVYIDLSRDKELFQGQGDIQFDVYRSMRAHNGDVWNTFEPRTNILWLNFLAAKIEGKILQHDGEYGEEFKELRERIGTFASAKDLIFETMWR